MPSPLVPVPLFPPLGARARALSLCLSLSQIIKSYKHAVGGINVRCDKSYVTAVTRLAVSVRAFGDAGSSPDPGSPPAALTRSSPHEAANPLRPSRPRLRFTHRPVTGTSCQRDQEAPGPRLACCIRVFTFYNPVVAKRHSRLGLRNVRVCVGDTSSIRPPHTRGCSRSLRRCAQGNSCPLSPHAHICGDVPGAAVLDCPEVLSLTFVDATPLPLLLEFIICLGDAEPLSHHQLL